MASINYEQGNHNQGNGQGSSRYSCPAAMVSLCPQGFASWFLPLAWKAALPSMPGLYLQIIQRHSSRYPCPAAMVSLVAPASCSPYPHWLSRPVCSSWMRKEIIRIPVAIAFLRAQRFTSWFPPPACLLDNASYKKVH